MIFDIVVDIVLLKRENIVFLLVERRKERSKKLSRKREKKREKKGGRERREKEKGRDVRGKRIHGGGRGSAACRLSAAAGENRMYETGDACCGRRQELSLGP